MINLFPRGRVFVDEARESEADALVAIHADAFTHAWSADDFAALDAAAARGARLARRRRTVKALAIRVGLSLFLLLRFGLRMTPWLFVAALAAEVLVRGVPAPWPVIGCR